MIMSQIEFERSFWEAYIKGLLKQHLVKNKARYTESGLIRASEKLADLLVNESDIFTNTSSILSGTFDAKTWLESKISTIKFD